MYSIPLTTPLPTPTPLRAALRDGEPQYRPDASPRPASRFPWVLRRVVARRYPPPPPPLRSPFPRRLFLSLHLGVQPHPYP